MIERCRAEADEDLARPGGGILHFLVPEDVGAAVLVDPDGLHGSAIVTGDTLAS
jgi:hypothetical protein